MQLTHEYLSEQMKQYSEMTARRNAKLWAWMRSVLTLATGALSVLVAFQPTATLGYYPALCLEITWILIGLGILSGSVFLYGEVHLENKQADKKRKNIQKQMETGEAEPPGAIASELPFRIRWCEPICYVSLSLAVITLVSYAILRQEQLKPIHSEPAASRYTGMRP